MGDYSGKKKIGGKVNSKISNQDSIAAVLAIEQINSVDPFKLECDLQDFCIKCEGDEDLEIFNQHNHVYIQVKSGVLNSTTFYKILSDFKKIDEDESKTNNYFVLITFENFKINGKNIRDQLDDYINVYLNEYETEDKKERIKQEIENDYSLKEFATIINRLRIVQRPLFRDGHDTKAIFSRNMRLYYSFKDPGDILVDALFNGLTDKFAELRRNRSFVSKGDLEIIINKKIGCMSAFSGISLQAGYKRIENGYIKSPEALQKRDELYHGFKIAKKRISSGWRKAYRKEFILSLLIGAKRCPKCGHPIMANVQGLFGIACPDCGFSPYVTMFLFCECGCFEAIKQQPEMDDESQIQYIKDYFEKRDGNNCRGCGRNLIDDYVEQRIFYAPIPYPYDELTDDEEMYKNSPY